MNFYSEEVVKQLSKNKIIESFNIFSSEFIESAYKVFKFLILYTVIFGIMMFGFKYALPFLIAYFIATFLGPLKFKILNFGAKKNCKLNPTMISMILTIVFVVVILAFMTGAGYQIFVKTKSFIEYVTGKENLEIITSSIDTISKYILDKMDRLDPTIVNSINDGVNKLTKELTVILTDLGKILLGFAVSLPQILIYIFITVTSIFFFTKDYENINVTIVKIFQEKTLDNFRKGKEKLKSTFYGYLKAYSVIMSCIFALCSTTYYLAGIKYAVLIGFITAVLDLLPLIGSGSVYLILIIISIGWGNYYSVLILLIGYGITVLVRTLLEQNLVASFVGLNPLVVIIGLFIAFSPLGLWGMLYFIGFFLLYKVVI